jgi:hypothetical protein
MAINQNHLSEELNGVKCAIVEKCDPERANFLKQLLLFNKYTAEIAASPPPKTRAGSGKRRGTVPPTPVAPETFTVGLLT